MIRFKQFVAFWSRHIGKAAMRWWRCQHADEAAALAFYSLISLVPILLVCVSVASVFVDEETATRILLVEANRVAGSTVGGYFAQILKTDIKWIGSGVSPILGSLFLVFAAMKLIIELRKSLGKVFGLPAAGSQKVALSGVACRVMSLMMLLILGMFIASAVVFETMMGVVMNSLNDSPWLLGLATATTSIFSFVALAILAAITMRWLPAKPPHFKEALVGGAASGFLLVGLKVGLAQMLMHMDIGSFYGSSLTLVLVLFWVYFAMWAFLYGAELAAQLAETRCTQESLPVMENEGTNSEIA